MSGTISYGLKLDTKSGNVVDLHTNTAAQGLQEMARLGASPGEVVLSERPY